MESRFVDAGATIASTTEDNNPSWTQLFLGILTQPIVTLKLLDRLCDRSDAMSKLTQQAFLTVLLTALLLGCSRINPQESFLSTFEIFSVITNQMFLWVFAAGALSLLSTILNDARPTRWKKALVLTGWSLAPVVFFAPMMCLKNTMGPFVLPFATIPTWFTLFLLGASFKIALGISVRKMLVIAMVLPPMLFLVYIFWTGLSLVLVISEIISAFAR